MGCTTSKGVVDFRVQNEFQPTSVLPEESPSGTEGMFHQQYLIGKKLGMGAFASVYTVKQVNSEKLDDEYAVKVMDQRTVVDGRSVNKVDQRVRKAVAKEVAILKKVGLWGPCIKMVDSYIDGPCSYIVMEKCDGSLLSSLERMKTLTELTILEVLRQMLTAICCIHSINVVHRDIKPDNFLVKNGAIKLCDFGMAEVLDKNKPSLVGVFGTAPYMSPEMLNGKPYDAMTDVWSMGVVAYVLLLGKFPYTPAKSNSHAMKAAVLAGTPSPDFEPQEGLPPVSSFAKQCLRSVLIRDPKMRPCAMDTLATFSNLAEETSSEAAQWGTTSLRPMLHAAKRVGAFSVPKLEDPNNVDNHVKWLQGKYHGTSLGTRSASKPKGKGSRVAVADICAAQAA